MGRLATTSKADKKINKLSALSAFDDRESRDNLLSVGSEIVGSNENFKNLRPAILSLLMRMRLFLKKIVLASMFMRIIHE